MQVGDIYRFSPEFIAQYSGWIKGGPGWEGGTKPGFGPFMVIAVYRNSCDVKSLENERIHKAWAHAPAHWGVFDPFLTAAYKATHERP